MRLSLTLRSDREEVFEGERKSHLRKLAFDERAVSFSSYVGRHIHFCVFNFEFMKSLINLPFRNWGIYSAKHSGRVKSEREILSKENARRTLRIPETVSNNHLPNPVWTFQRLTDMPPHASNRRANVSTASAAVNLALPLMRAAII